MKTIALVSCTREQYNQPKPARRLFRSDWFISAVGYAETAAITWYILSARYGLLHPDQTIAPYTQTLEELSPVQRQTWAAGVQASLSRILQPNDRLILLTRQIYCEDLYPLLLADGRRLKTPLAGLTEAQQITWLQEAVDHPTGRIAAI